MTTIHPVFAVALAFALLATPARPAVASQRAPLRLHPVADGTVCERHPDQGYGTSPELHVRRKADGLRLSYLRFEVPAFTEESCFLRLHATRSTSDGGTLYLAQDSEWTEADLTWRRQPLRSITRITDIGVVAENSWIEIDVTSVVNGPGTYVFALAPGVLTDVSFSSREAYRLPELSLTHPERRAAAIFAADLTAGRAPFAVAFTDRSKGSLIRWKWSFGDGTKSTQRHPVHTFQDPGVYNVRLTVTDSLGTSHTRRTSICALPAPSRSLWTSPTEIAQLATAGPLWEAVKTEADQPKSAPNLSDKNDNADVRVLAQALVFARTGDPSYRARVIEACMSAIGTEVDGDTLALGRNLASYVIAADLVVLPVAEDCAFRNWLRDCLTLDLSGRTLVSAHEDRPNNWGAHAGASRVAVAVYLGDEAQIKRCAQVFKGWLGDRAAYSGFIYGSLDWQADPSQPVGINPRGATRNGHSIDGVLPDDQRRRGTFKWPPPKVNYVWEALQGVLVQAVILHRVGYNTWNWEDRAVLRAMRWLHDECDYPARGDDTWQPHLVNYFYATGFPSPTPSQPGKNMGWTDWTHARKRFNPMRNPR